MTLSVVRVECIDDRLGVSGVKIDAKANVMVLRLCMFCCKYIHFIHIFWDLYDMLWEIEMCIALWCGLLWHALRFEKEASIYRRVSNIWKQNDKKPKFITNQIIILKRGKVILYAMRWYDMVWNDEWESMGLYAIVWD